MPKLPVVKGRELIRALSKLRFFEHHRVGSHIQLKHPDGRRTTISLHHGKDIPDGTLRAILGDIDLSVEKFVSVLKNK